MAKPSGEDRFVKKPIYPGGLTAMRKLIKENLQYPEDALKQKIEGSVYLRYGIDYKGNVSEVKIKQSLGYGCDEEAERIVRLFKFDVPKIPRKLKVAFHKTIRIHFKLPKAKKKKPVQSTIQYTVTKNKEKQAPIAPKKSYTYTITY